YVHRDHLGSTNALTDSAGNLVERVSYDPHGEVHGQPLGADDPATLLRVVPRGFTGAVQLRRSQLVHLNGRVYDPRLGRFLPPPRASPVPCLPPPRPARRPIHSRRPAPPTRATPPSRSSPRRDSRPRSHPPRAARASWTPSATRSDPRGAPSAAPQSAPELQS